MKKFGWTITIMVMFGLVLAAFPLFAQADLQPAAIVKLHKTEPITVRQYNEQLAKTEMVAKRSLTLAEKKQVLDTMIDERLVLQAAEKDKITVSDKEIDQQLQQARLMTSQSAGRELSQSEFENVIKTEAGMSYAEYREGVRKQLVAQKYMMNKKRAEFESMPMPSKEEIQSAYDLNQTKLVRPHTVKASLILVQSDGSADGPAKAKKLADSLAKEIGNSSSKFDEVAFKARTGKLGYEADTGAVIPRIPEVQQLFGQAFITALFGLRVDEISAVIDTPRGYMIAKPLEVYAQKMLTLEDPYQPGATVTVRDYLGNQLLQQKQAQLVEKVTRDLITELRKGKPYQIFEKNLGL